MQQLIGFIDFVHLGVGLEFVGEDGVEGFLMGGVFDLELVLFLEGLVERCVVDCLVPFLLAEVEVAKQVEDAAFVCYEL